MNILKNIIAVITGVFIGSFVNMSLIDMGANFYPIEGVIPGDMEALVAVMPSLSAEYFIFPFIAHALGTLVGAVFAGMIAGTHKMKFIWSIGTLFFIGGVMASIMLPAPTWFIVVDLVFAYFPMAWISVVLVKKMKVKE